MMSEELVKLFPSFLRARSLVIPPYASDDDEGDKDPEEYLELLVKNFSRLGDASRNYRQALVAFCAIGDDGTVQGLLEARREFIQCLPFVIDDLEGDKNSPLFPGYLLNLRETYRRECAASLQERLSEFINITTQLALFVGS